jgi:cellulose 1,4-beta-cellobiosidase
VDSTSKLHGKRNLGTVEGVLTDAGAMTPPPLVVLVVYNLPNRDCDAEASKGELCCARLGDGSGTCDYQDEGECDAGVTEYEQTFIDPLAALLREHKDKVPVVLVVEPDSLPNLATSANGANPNCGSVSTSFAYQNGVRYAVNTLKDACGTSCDVYLDAAHGGWLGWDGQVKAIYAHQAHRRLGHTALRGWAKLSIDLHDQRCLARAGTRRGQHH